MRFNRGLSCKLSFLQNVDAKEKDERDPEGLQGFQEEVLRAETEDGHGASRHAREMNASWFLRVPFF